MILSLAFAAALALPQPLPQPPPIPAAVDTPYPGTIALEADARDVTHRIVHVRETLPVAAGPLTLLYPEWVPGSHSPINTADHLAGLTIAANGHPARLAARCGRRARAPPDRAAGRR